MVLIVEYIWHQHATMPSNAKLARTAAKSRSPEKQAILDAKSEQLVIKFVMPSVIKLANDNFTKDEATILLVKFQEKAFEYFKTQQDKTNKQYMESSATETGLVLTIDKEIVVSVYLDKPKILHTNKQEKLLDAIKKDRQKSRGETFFYYHRAMETSCWGTNEELREEMLSWRKQKRNKTLVIIQENNHEFVIDGKTYYTLTLTQTDADGVAQQIGIDPLGIGVGHFVDGIIYWFVAKANRDAVYNYVMEIK